MIAVVHLFAGARELAGADSISVEMPTGTTVGELRRVLSRCQPALLPLLVRSRIALNREFAEDSAIIPEGVELALIPPVSGGSA